MSASTPYYAIRYPIPGDKIATSSGNAQVAKVIPFVQLAHSFDAVAAAELRRLMAYNQIPLHEYFEVLLTYPDLEVDVAPGVSWAETGATEADGIEGLYGEQVSMFEYQMLVGHRWWLQPTE